MGHRPPQGGQGEDNVRNLTISALALLSFAASFAQTGNTWSQPLSQAQDPPDWPAALEGIHACHIPPASGNQYGRIVFWGHGVDEQSVDGKSTQAYVWDTSITSGVRFIDQSGTPTLSPVSGMRLIGINLFCAGHTGDKDGNVFVSGGEELEHSGDGITASAKFLYSTLSWSVQDSMEQARWYPTLVPLADGSLLTVAGNDEEGVWSDTPERFTFSNPSNQWSIFDAVVQNSQGQWVPFDSDNYPFMFTIHNSGDPLVFWAGKRRHSSGGTNAALRSHLLNISSETYVEFPANPQSTEVPKEGSGAVIWIDGTTTAKKGTVIKAGGNGTFDSSVDPGRFIATDETWYIDLDQGTPVWDDAGDMVAPATDNNLVWLPTGKLLSVGGSKYDHDWILDNPHINHSVRTQIYDPVAKTWSSLTSMPGSEFRWYHSTAVLLPDGSVLSAGSNDEHNGRIYYPTYFGGTRPVVTAAPTSQVSYNGTFELTLQSGGPSIEMVSLIRLNATTHGFDQGQRFIKCDYSQNGTTLTVTSPKNGAIAPPGWYMVFVVSTSGVPSHARYVEIG
jgi:hypothetical protein